MSGEKVVAIVSLVLTVIMIIFIVIIGNNLLVLDKRVEFLYDDLYEVVEQDVTVRQTKKKRSYKRRNHGDDLIDIQQVE